MDEDDQVTSYRRFRQKGQYLPNKEVTNVGLLI